MNEYLQTVQDSEREKHTELPGSHLLVHSPQETINILLMLKDEHIKLTEENKSLSRTVDELRAQLFDEIPGWRQRMRDMKVDYDKKSEELKNMLPEEALEAKGDLEIRARLELQRDKSAKSLQELENSRSEDITSTDLQNGETLPQLEMTLNELQTEYKQVTERASADISIHKKKVMDLQQEISQLKHLTISSSKSYDKNLSQLEKALGESQTEVIQVSERTSESNYIYKQTIEDLQQQIFLLEDRAISSSKSYEEKSSQLEKALRESQAEVIQASKRASVSISINRKTIEDLEQQISMLEDLNKSSHDTYEEKLSQLEKGTQGITS